MANAAWTPGKAKLLTEDIDSLVWKLLLLNTTGSYAFNADHDTLSDLTLGTNELSTTNYARKALTLVSASTDLALDRAGFSFSPVVYSALGVISGPSVKAAVAYIDNGSDSTSVPVLYLDSVAFATNGDDVAVSFHATMAAYL